MDFNELLKDVFENKDVIKKYLPVMQMFVQDPKTKAILAGVACAISEYEKLCPDGDC